MERRSSTRRAQALRQREKENEPVQKLTGFDLYMCETELGGFAAMRHWIRGMDNSQRQAFQARCKEN
ncbi:hypothetical protein BASA81_003158 [Batrachochytrium salamandrivorans]|nr:hypothetical protein BASA81_003158 [Batrachochytrium salamandrivorans]